MHVRCRHCYQQIELVREDLTAEVICSSWPNRASKSIARISRQDTASEFSPKKVALRDC
jgi:hypothetical protein